jgi:type II restriction/modification system DNA methylase subunit YeeA
MNVAEFVAKWSKSELRERQGSQSHFIDICDLLGCESPAAADPCGEWFCFEKGAAKHGGGEGWADVWRKDCFGWEYKGRHKNLDAAYDQLLLYRNELENPPLLIVSDMDRIVIHTNFTGTKDTPREMTLATLAEPKNLQLLRDAFCEPEKLRPGLTREAITEEAAGRIAALAQSLRDRGQDPAAVAHFLDRIVFCLFAEDVGLLPPKLFARVLQNSKGNPAQFTRALQALFDAMAHGGLFGPDLIKRFNGNLFNDTTVLELTPDEIAAVTAASRLEWGGVDPSIFGTLFERGLDPSKRSQLGAHYTSRADIETLVEPVVMTPLRREWSAVKTRIENLPDASKKPLLARKNRDESIGLVNRFLLRLSSVKVLDPACGSGNFLYVTLQKLKDLEKEVILFCNTRLGEPAFPQVGPWQLHGIEINPYAHDLAQMTIWIGYLQWTRANGFGVTQDPILRLLDTFKCMDAILDLSDPENPKEPEWPAVDFIVGNPPFLGTKMLRGQLGDTYVEKLFQLYKDRIPGFSDLCCYWFERARTEIDKGRCGRAGLLATQGIRGGLNREVLKKVINTGGIFFAESDRPWVLDGANVHVSMVAFDNGLETVKTLDGRAVSSINSNLTSATDITLAQRLSENAGIGFIADVKAGKFDIEQALAREFLLQPSPNLKPNSDVLVPWTNGFDVLARPRGQWIIDFENENDVRNASAFDGPFAHIQKEVFPERSKVKRKRYREYWWLHAEPCLVMRKKIRPLDRYLVTAVLSKHRVFSWMRQPVLPDHQLCVFARSDDYFLGVLHSRPHEVWTRAQGTQLREKESGFRYTPTTCFETFPLPHPTPAQETAIAAAAKELDELRNGWLNPPEWTREEVLEFPGSADGPWARYVHNPDARGVGTVRWPRIVAKDDASAKLLAKRTLTNLYNQRPAWLDLAHKKLDAAVLAAYGWADHLTDEEILEKLLTLNLERAGK